MTRTTFSGIQAKLVSLFLLLAVLSTTAVTVLFYRTAGQIISSSIRSHLETVAKGQTELISGWMDERQHDIEVLARNNSIKRQLAALVDSSGPERPEHRDLTGLLRLVRDQYGAYHEIVAFNTEGTILATTRSTANGLPLSKPALLESVGEGRLYTGELGRSDTGDALSLTVAAPVNADTGEVIGGIAAQINLDAINDMTDSTNLMESGETYLVDQRGFFLTHRDRRRVLRDQIDGVMGVREVTSGHDGVGEYADYRGVEVLGAYRWLPRWQWGLVVEVDRAEAFAPLREARRSLLVVAVLVMASVLFVTLLIARRIVGPLRQLTTAVQAMAAGSFGQQLSAEGTDEIAYLNESFNHMAASVATAQEDLQARVQRATSDLEEKNERLERANRELSEANHKLEQQTAILMHSAKLAALGEMAAGFAHEINNPLTTIKSLVHLAQEGPQDIRAQDLDVLSEEVDRVSRLVLSFLDYARPHESGMASVDVGAIATKAIELVGSQLADKNIRIDTHIDHAAPEIRGDPEQVKQVLINLLLNAIQASEPTSTIEVFVKSTFSDSPDIGPQVQFGVTDRGCGIPQDNLTKIFGPFYTTKPNGFGLGLAVVQRIIREHGGTISCASQEDVGTTFFATIPVHGDS